MWSLSRISRIPPKPFEGGSPAVEPSESDPSGPFFVPEPRGSLCRLHQKDVGIRRPFAPASSYDVEEKRDSKKRSFRESRKLLLLQRAIEDSNPRPFGP